MGFFKQQVNLEDFCRNFYDNPFFYLLEQKIDDMGGFAEFTKKAIVEADSKFADVDLQKLKDELTFLRFELFALAWTHKFISGKIVIAQSIFTKNYLKDKEMNDIWIGMNDYNESIHDATIHWLNGLGKINMPFNTRMMGALIDDNIKVAKEMGVIEAEADAIKKVDNRLWSENAWRQKFILTYLQPTFYENLNVNSETLNDEALVLGAIIIKSLYDDAKLSLDNIKISK